jgi:GntR family transcriptional regulator, transcriptional repressor for pyruvate dehydrogenase complex
MEAVSRKTFQVVRKVRVSEEIIGQVRDLITSGRLKVGDRLPAERDLAKTLEVGRSTVREAIRALESLGVLQARPGEGTFLVSNPADQRTDQFAADVFKSWDNQRKLFEVRMVIEPDLASLAARRATPDHIKRMHEVLNDQEKLVRQGGNGIKADTSFHFLLAEASGNDILIRLMDGLMDRLQETREASLNTGGRPLRSLKQHRAILRAVESRDSETAEQRMIEHIQEMEGLAFAAQELRGGAADPAPRPSKLGDSE